MIFLLFLFLSHGKGGVEGNIGSSLMQLCGCVEMVAVMKAEVKNLFEIQKTTNYAGGTNIHLHPICILLKLEENIVWGLCFWNIINLSPINSYSKKFEPQCNSIIHLSRDKNASVNCTHRKMTPTS